MINDVNTSILMTRHRYWLLCVLSIGTLFCSVSTGYAQNYYPDELGNIWFLRSTDGISERVVSIKGPEKINGESLKIIEDQTNDLLFSIDLKFQTDLDNEVISEDLRKEFENHRIIPSLVEVKKRGSMWLVVAEDQTRSYNVRKGKDKLNIYTNDNISQLFFKREPEALKVFRSVVSVPLLGRITFDYSPPQTFLPTRIDLGSQWTIISEAEVPLAGKIQSTIDVTVVAIEDVAVPAGTFQNCLKIEQEITGFDGCIGPDLRPVHRSRR